MPQEYTIHKFTSHRRTITETDIVNFVNLTGLHEPYFIDMEFLKENMSGAHRNRFVPGPLIVSYSMGLVSTQMMNVVRTVLEGHEAGPFAGMMGFDTQIKAGVFPGDTLQVELEAWIKAKTSRGYTLMDLRHVVKNQRSEVVAEFTEHVMFHPPVAK